MRIQVTEVEGPITQTGKNNRPYKMIVLKYLSNGKGYEKKLTQFSEAYPLFSEAQAEELYTVDLVKDGAFTEWKNAALYDEGKGAGVTETKPDDIQVKTEKGPGRPAGSKNKASEVMGTTSKSTSWETTEERKARQELIVRQSSLTNAIEFLKLQSQGFPEGVTTVTDVADVLEVAKEFRNFVYSAQELSVVTDVDSVE